MALAKDLSCTVRKHTKIHARNDFGCLSVHGSEMIIFFAKILIYLRLKLVRLVTREGLQRL
jgi:hypothetical protein